jgi:hypothetical protein
MKEGSNNNCSCFSLITSLILLNSAAIGQCIQGYPDSVTLSFLLVGISSLIHHSRLNKWWINDFWRWLDYFFIIIFSSIIIYNFYDFIILYITIILILNIVIFIWSGYLNEIYIPYIHGIIHILISFCVLYLIYHRKNNKNNKNYEEDFLCIR